MLRELLELFYETSVLNPVGLVPSWVFRGSKIFSRGYFVGPNFFSRGYFVGIRLFLVGNS